MLSLHTDTVLYTTDVVLIFSWSLKTPPQKLSLYNLISPENMNIVFKNVHFTNISQGPTYYVSGLKREELIK